MKSTKSKIIRERDNSCTFNEHIFDLDRLVKSKRFCEDWSRLNQDEPLVSVSSLSSEKPSVCDSDESFKWGPGSKKRVSEFSSLKIPRNSSAFRHREELDAVPHHGPSNTIQE